MSPVDCGRVTVLKDRFPDDTIYDYYIYDGTFGRVTSQYKYNYGDIVHVEGGGELSVCLCKKFANQVSRHVTNNYHLPIQRWCFYFNLYIYSEVD